MSEASVDRAIVVGIARYPQFALDGSSGNDLEGPVNDATAMADWLVNEATAHVTLVTSNGDGRANWTVTDLRPNPQDIQQGFHGFVQEGLTSPTRRLARRLYVYMAGHGFAPEPRHLALITADALSDQIVPNIQATSWVDWFAEQTFFDEFVLWMDCCATRTYMYAGGKPLMKQAASRPGDRAKVFMGFAAKPSREAFEGPVGAHGEIRGLFTDRLLRGLKGAAAHGDGIVRTSGLVSYIKNASGIVGDGKVASSGARLELEANFPEQDELVFADVSDRLPEYVLRVPLADGITVDVVDVRNGVELPVAQGAVAGGVVRVKLGLGLYRAQAPSFRRLFEIASGTDSQVSLA